MKSNLENNIIMAEKLSYSFPQKVLYNKISFTLEENKHCAFIGKNGTGKSTLLDIICDDEKYIYEGKLKVREGMRIGHVNQYYDQDKNNDKTVFEYLSEEFVQTRSSIEEVCERMGSTDDLESVMEEYQKLYDYGTAIDVDNFENNIRRELRFADISNCENLSLNKLSGGEYKLVCIIKEMLILPDLLIMDEPDGFLDFDNLNSLMKLINSYSGTMIVVTHNRYLLNHCFDKIWHLENTELQEFDGNYTNYNYTLLTTKIDLMEQSAKDEAEIERNKAVVDKMRKQATKVDCAALGRQVHARASHLALLEARKIKAPFLEISHPDIEFSTECVSEADTAINITNYSSGFEKPLLENVSFDIGPNDKIALVGANGTGKTTLLRDIVKSIKDNNMTEISIAEDIKADFMSQANGETLVESDTIAQELEKLGIENELQAEEYLSRFDISKEMLHSRISTLSGGERNLLQLARITKGNANLLIMDEPTNHLDTYAQIALEDAVKAYNGAILMVSHDFYTIVNCTDYTLLIEDGAIRKLSTRAFRKLIYKKYFDKEYLAYEEKKKELELRINAALSEKNFKAAHKASDELGNLINK